MDELVAMNSLDSLVAQGDYSQVQDWSLVLSSQQIEHQTQKIESGDWAIFTTPDIAKVAKEQIETFVFENHMTQDTMGLPPLMLSLQPLWVLAVPTLITLMSTWPANHLMKGQGMNDADRLFKGEWWRIFTAQTLHSNSHHLASNLISGYFVLSILAARIPLTRLVSPLLLATGLANAAVSWTWGTDFRSLGFSTFVFAALGSMAAIEWRLLPKNTVGLFKRFEPLLSSLFIAIMMGVGENSDVLAHFYGLIAGIFAGIALPKKWFLHHELSWKIGPMDVMGGFAYLGVIAVAWSLAL